MPKFIWRPKQERWAERKNMFSFLIFFFFSTTLLILVHRVSSEFFISNKYGKLCAVWVCVCVCWYYSHISFVEIQRNEHFFRRLMFIYLALVMRSQKNILGWTVVKTFVLCHTYKFQSPFCVFFLFGSFFFFFYSFSGFVSFSLFGSFVVQFSSSGLCMFRHFKVLYDWTASFRFYFSAFFCDSFPFDCCCFLALSHTHTFLRIGRIHK